MDAAREYELACALNRAMNLLSITDRAHQTPDVYGAVRAARYELETMASLLPERRSAPVLLPERNASGEPGMLRELPLE